MIPDFVELSSVQLFMRRTYRRKEKQLVGVCSTWRTFAQSFGQRNLAGSCHWDNKLIGPLRALLLALALRNILNSAARSSVLALDFRCAFSRWLKSGLAAINGNRCSTDERSLV